MMSELTGLLEYLTPRERVEIDRLISLQNSAIWHPHPANHPQCEAYATPAFETLFGGSAGGGKTDLILGLARTRHSRSLLLRRTFPDLERSLISRSLEFFGDRQRYNGSKYVWNIDGRRIEFGHMDRVGTPTQPGSEVQYASAPYDFIGFDQLEQFPEYAYDFMLSRARTTIKGQRVRVVATANPIGEFVEWIMCHWRAWLDEKYPYPAKPGEIRYYKRDEKGIDTETSPVDPDGVSRTFIPAGLKDNPYLGDEYRKTLNMTPEPLRSALLNGDWMASLTDEAYQIVPRAWVKLANENYESWRVSGRLGYCTSLGCDVGGGAPGGDPSVLAPCYDRTKINELTEFIPSDVNTATMELAGFAMGMHKRLRGGVVSVDAIGIGAGVTQRLFEMGVPVIPFVASAGTELVDKSGAYRFSNWRSAGWWLLRELLDPDNKFYPCLPPDDALIGEITSAHYKILSSGIIQVEGKDIIKRRIGRSTDHADAVIHALFGQLLNDERIARQGGHVEYNPVVIGPEY